MDRIDIARRNVSLSRKLNEEIKRHMHEANWSKLARKAWKKKLKELRERTRKD